MTRVAALQLSPVVGDFAGNIARVNDAIDRGLSEGADLIVLPELATSGYVFESVDELRSMAISADSPAFAEWSERAASRAGAVIVAGFAEAGDDGELYNSAAVITGEGVLGIYRKVHLWDQEKRFFTAGNRAPLVMDTPVGRLGVMICYDLEFPEWTRMAALEGTEILAVPTNWPLVKRPDGERAPEVQIAMSVARVNHMTVICADRAGLERGVEWNEGTSIISADGWIVDAVGPGNGIALGDVDPASSRDKQLAPLANAFLDRRPDLYSAVVRQPEVAGA